MKKIWIALSGKAGCGKSTIADALNKKGFIRMSFAHRLKVLCKELFPEKMTENKEEYRDVLQKFGMYARNIDPIVWINVVVRILNRLNYPKVVIDDLRFYNEWWALKSRGFKMVRIHRADHLRAKHGYNVKDKHPSETQLDILKPEDWDLMVYNNFKYPFEEAIRFIVKSLEIEK